MHESSVLPNYEIIHYIVSVAIPSSFLFAVCVFISWQVALFPTGANTPKEKPLANILLHCFLIADKRYHSTSVLKYHYVHVIGCFKAFLK